MYLAFPISLQLSVNETRHTVAEAKRFQNPIDMKHQVKGVVGTTIEDTQNKLVESVNKFIENLSLGDTRIQLADFRLFYSCEEIKDGKVWFSDSGSRNIPLYPL